MKFFTILILSVLTCWGGKLQVVESTSQEWVGGLQESGYGTDYKITITAKAGSDLLKIEDIWVGDQHLKFRVMVDPANPKIDSFKKGDRILIKAGTTQKPDQNGKMKLSGDVDQVKPKDYKGVALIGYSYKGHKKYLAIPEFKQLEKIIYP